MIPCLGELPMPGVQAGLQVERLCKSYPTPAEDLVVLEQLDLCMQPGTNLAIVGSSGSGKSTLLQILGTLDRPTSGTVLLEGADPFQLDEHHLARFRNQKIGFVFQDHHLLPHLNVFENTILPAMALGTPSREQQERATALLSRVGLGHRLGHLPSELSGGERGRVAVARGLMMKPLLLLADEPTGNLDPDHAQRVLEMLLALQKEEGTMLVVVTHSMEIARQMERCVRLVRGRLEEVSWSRGENSL
jgi:lipoprotein-releasing system ATP-binding protein